MSQPDPMTDLSIKMREIISKVVEATGISAEEMRSKSRRQVVSDARFIAYREILQAAPGIRRDVIASYFNRDVSSISYGLRMYSEFREYSPEFRDKAVRVENSTKGNE